jgi:hypothetical protein
MTVIRIKKQDNFVTLYKACLQDVNISLKSKGLWAFCMGQPDDWTFHVSQLATVLKEGEDAIYSALKELIEHGYCKRIQNNINGKFQTVDYEINEFPEEFKKRLPHRDFPDAGLPDAGNPGLLSIDPIPSIEEKTNVRPPASHSQARGYAQLLLEAIKKTKPDIKPPNISSWEKEIDRMLRIDKRSEESLKAILKWLPTAPRSPNGFCWADNILSAEALRAQFDKLELAMRQNRSECHSEDLGLISKLEERKDLISKGKLIVGADYVEFPEIRDACFKVGEPAFQEKVLSTLRKIGVAVKLP